MGIKGRSASFHIRRTPRESRGLSPTEHVEAVRFMRAAKYHEKAYPALKWLFAIPNGGWRNKIVAAKLKSEGVKPGVHDYMLPVPAKGYHGLFLELKNEGGRPTKEQLDFAEFVAEQGYQVVFCKGWVQAWSVVCEYLGIRSQVT